LDPNGPDQVVPATFNELSEKLRRECQRSQQIVVQGKIFDTEASNVIGRHLKAWLEYQGFTPHSLTSSMAKIQIQQIKMLVSIGRFLGPT
jgi:hypothetical protein